MYKYFTKLDNPGDFKIYLKDSFGFLRNNKKYYKPLSLEFVLENKNLFSKLKELDKIIIGHNEKFGYPLFMDGDKRWILSEIYYYPEDLQQEREECGLEEIKMITNTRELIRKLKEYEVYCNYFIELYPDLETYFQNIKSAIESALEKITACIELPPKNTIFEYLIPNGFFITKSGFLYNPNGKVGSFVKGHKEGNLKVSFDNIRDSIISNQNIDIPYYGKVPYKDYLKKLIKDGCVNEIDFQNYANMTLDFNTIVTEKLLRQEQFWNRVVSLPDREISFINIGDKKIGIERKNEERERIIKWVQPSEMKVSYQPNINTLVQGYFAAVIDLYDAFQRLNPSSKKSELFEKIYRFSWGDFYVNTLIKFCGFHKVETCEKKITTSSLDGVDLFRLYLERGWDLYIVPPIVYDAYLDDVAELEMHSYYVEKHFEKVLKEYEGKGRVLVRDINC